VIALTDEELWNQFWLADMGIEPFVPQPPLLERLFAQPRLACLIHKDGSQSRMWCPNQESAVAWLEQNYSAERGDKISIVSDALYLPQATKGQWR
jgi:hypothetical protein